MSKILEAIAERGSKIIDEKGAEFIGKLLDDTDALVEKHVPEELRGHATDAVAALRSDEVKGAVLNLTKIGLGKVVGLFESGDEKGAERIYMATEATTQERIDFQNQSGDAAELLYAKREKEWAALLEALKRIGSIAVSALGVLLTGLL